ncbi:MAG: T9SS type A sorting domain-containing protein [Ignavibacteria bacterium]
MILTNVSAQSYNPAVAAKNQIVHVVWHDTRYGNEEVFYMRSSNAGSNWGSEVRLTNNTGISYYPSICLSGTSVHLAWYDNSDGNFEIYYGLSTNEGLTWQPNTRLTYKQYDSYRPSIAAQDTMLHIIWNDNRDGDWEMYYKRNFTTGTIHIGNITSEIPSEVILRQNYPNPFNPETKISFAIPKEGYTTLRVFDVNGKEVKTLVNENKRAGNYSVDFNAGSLSSGIYFCSLKSGGVTITRKLILLK